MAYLHAIRVRYLFWPASGPQRRFQFQSLYRRLRPSRVAERTAPADAVADSLNVRRKVKVSGTFVSMPSLAHYLFASPLDPRRAVADQPRQGRLWWAEEGVSRPAWLALTVARVPNGSFLSLRFWRLCVSGFISLRALRTLRGRKGRCQFSVVSSQLLASAFSLSPPACGASVVHQFFFTRPCLLLRSSASISCGAGRASLNLVGSFSTSRVT